MHFLPEHDYRLFASIFDVTNMHISLESNKMLRDRNAKRLYIGEVQMVFLTCVVSFCDLM